jgi:hypothetical protein
MPGRSNSRILAACVLLLCALTATFADAQVVVNTFEGIDASGDPNPELNIDPNGAVGTKQYMEWTNIAFQAWDKTTFAPVWSAPQLGILPWQQAHLSNCNISGDGFVVFDRVASRWVLGGITPIAPAATIITVWRFPIRTIFRPRA